MVNKTIAIIQARLTSTRFPNKILEKVNNKTLIEILISRLNKSKKIDQIVVATPNDKSNRKIKNYVGNTKIFFGSENDVLDRYYKASTKYKASTIVRICADCPFIDPTVIDKIINLFVNFNTYTIIAR